MASDGLKWIQMKKNGCNFARFNNSLLKICHVYIIQQPCTSYSCKYLISSKIDRYHIPTILVRAIDDSFACTNSTSVVKFLRIEVSMVLYLPLAELELHRIKFSSLQMGKICLDRCRRERIRSRVDHPDAELPHGAPRLTAMMVRGIVKQQDALVTPVRFI